MGPAVAATIVVLALVLIAAWIFGFAFSWIEGYLSGWIALPLAFLPFVVIFWLRVYVSMGGS